MKAAKFMAGMQAMAGILVIYAVVVGNVTADQVVPEPYTQCTYEAVLPDGARGGEEPLILEMTERGYDVIKFALYPQNPHNEPTMAAFDTGQRKVVLLDEAINNDRGEGATAQTDAEMIRISEEFAREGDDLVKLSRRDGREISRAEGLLAGVNDNAVAAIDGIGWARRLTRQLRGEEITAGGLAEGLVVFAREPDDAGEAARLFLYRAALDEIMDLGPMTDPEGDPIDRVDNIAFLRSWDFAVLAGNEHRSAIQIYQNPVMDIMAYMTNEAMRNAAERAGDETVTARFIDSLYNYQENSDRTFASMGLASDGRIYFGVMPHHPTIGAPLFRYDPAIDELKYYGEFDEIAGTKAPGIIPNMVHDRPIELNGRLYITGQDPFYGKYDFPGMTPENTRYPGSPVISLEMESGEWTSHGVPIPSARPELADVFGGESIFHMVADPHRNDLYMRPGYNSGDWWVVEINEETGGFAGEPRKSGIAGWPAMIHVADDGYIYYPIVRDQREEDGRFGSPCFIVRFDPDSGENVIVNSFTAEQLSADGVVHALEEERPLDFEPSRAQGRQPNNISWAMMSSQTPGRILGVMNAFNIIVRFDIETGGIVKLAEKPRGLGAFAAYHDRGYFFARDRRGYPGETVLLTVIDFETGEAKEVGRMVDDRGRWFTQITDVCFTADGKPVLSAQIYAAPGDPYMRRYRRPPPIDSCLWMIDKPDKLWE